MQGGAGWRSGAPVWGRGAWPASVQPLLPQTPQFQPQPLREWKPGIPAPQSPSSPALYSFPRLRRQAHSWGSKSGDRKRGNQHHSARAMGLAPGGRGSPLRASSHQPRWKRHDHCWCPNWETKASLVTWLDWEVKAHRVSRLLCCGPPAQAQFKAGEERSLVLPTAQPLSVPIPIVAAWCLGLLTLRCR